MTVTVCVLAAVTSCNVVFLAGIAVGAVAIRVRTEPWVKRFTKVLVAHIPDSEGPAVLADLERLRREISDA